MARSTNFTVVVGADTSPFTAGMNKAKSGLAGFEKSVSGMAGKLMDAFGLPGDQLASLTQNIGGAIQQINQLGREGGTAISKLVAGMGSLATAIGGLGIAGAVIAFKQLTEAANNFKTLEVGRNLQVEADAFRSTVKQAMLDMHQETAEASARLMTDLGNWWVEGVAQFKGAIFNMIEGASIGDAWKQAKIDTREAAMFGDQAAIFARRINDAERAIAASQGEWHRMASEIAEARKDAMDYSLSEKERSDALAKAVELTKQLAKEQEILYRKREQNVRSLVGLTESTPEENDSVVAAEIAVYDVRRKQAEDLKSLDRIGKNIANSSAAKAKAEEAALAAMRKQGEQMAKLSQMSDQTVWEQVAENGLANIDLSNVSGFSGAAQQKNAPSIIVPVKPVLDRTEWDNLLTGLQESLSSAFIDIADVIGGTLADLFEGGSIDSLFSGFLKTIGGFAKKFGAALMAFGLAKTALIKSVMSMNPASAGAAIAAGAALVAVGAALSSIASSIGGKSGGYSSSSVASSSYGSTGTGSAYERSITVEVVGTLRANGSVLEAVLAGENNRKKNVT